MKETKKHSSLLGGPYLTRMWLKISGTPGGSRTPNLLVRSQALYPIELRVQNDLHHSNRDDRSKPKATILTERGSLNPLEDQRCVVTPESRIVAHGNG